MKRNSNLNCSMFLLWTRIHLSSISKKLLKRMIFNTLVALSIRPFYHKLCYIFDIHCIWVSLLNVFIFRNEIYIISILPSHADRMGIGMRRLPCNGSNITWLNTIACVSSCGFWQDKMSTTKDHILYKDGSLLWGNLVVGDSSAATWLGAETSSKDNIL